uniref:Uncharacterized protein n=1 Tax=Ovis aries TaxID=9940 RepID=A0AC11CE01_SHEEP
PLLLPLRSPIVPQDFSGPKPFERSLPAPSPSWSCQATSCSCFCSQEFWDTHPQRDFLCIICLKPSLERLEPPSAASCLGPHPSGSCSGCGPLSLPLLAGLVAADAVVSLLIVVVVFVCARLRSRPTQEDDKIYINMPGRG